MLMEIKKKKRIILEDEASDWFHNWMTASSLDVIGKKSLLTGWFSQILSHETKLPHFCYQISNSFSRETFPGIVGGIAV